MAKFEDVIEQLINDEGSRYTNYPEDPGGPTKYGITLKTAQRHNLDLNKDGVVDAEDVKLITKEIAEVLYKADYWLPIYDEINSTRVASKLFNEGVNENIVHATKQLQQALVNLGNKITVDGHFGPVTLGALNSTDEAMTMVQFKSQIKKHYEAIIAANPKEEMFRNGWMARADRG